MSTFSRGAAFIDGTGAVLAADPGFLAELGLSVTDPSGDLRRRAEVEPALRELLGGGGAGTATISGPGGGLSVERHLAPGGALLVVRAARDAEVLEHAVRSQGLARLAAGLAHDIKNPLNAMVLQLALLGEKLGGEAQAAGTGGHLTALQAQVAKVDEVLRRFCDVADPTAPYGWVDLGAVLGDIAHLFGHEVRRRRIRLELETPALPARAAAPPERAVRLVLGLFGRAMAETPDGGRVRARVVAEDGQAVLALTHSAGDPDPDLGYYSEVAAGAAAALGGSLQVARSDAQAELVLRLPRGGHE